MNTLFRNILTASFHGSIVILAVMLLRLVLKNENATVTSLISKEQAQCSRLQEMMEETFEGSVPAFLAAFSKSKRLTAQEVAQLQSMIDDYQEEEP